MGQRLVVESNMRPRASALAEGKGISVYNSAQLYQDLITQLVAFLNGSECAHA